MSIAAGILIALDLLHGGIVMLSTIYYRPYAPKILPPSFCSSGCFTGSTSQHMERCQPFDVVTWGRITFIDRYHLSGCSQDPRSPFASSANWHATSIAVNIPKPPRFSFDGSRNTKSHRCMIFAHL
ncbi:hypothetical protein BJX99DRAFT_226248 [Aspergillus californicus]